MFQAQNLIFRFRFMFFFLEFLTLNSSICVVNMFIIFKHASKSFKNSKDMLELTKTIISRKNV